MQLHSILKKIFFVASIACLGLPYILSGNWITLIIFLAMTFLGTIMKKWSVFWSTSSLLFIDVFFAAIGVVVHLPVLLMVGGCTSALVSWDLTNFGQGMVKLQRLEAVERLERYHLQSLLIAISLGLILALISSYANLQISFGATVLFVLIAVGCLTFGLQTLIKKNP